jgi:hypothetical protein
MLVVLSPAFDGSDRSYLKLAEATGLVPYDLRSRVKPGQWGVLKAVGDVGQAQELAAELERAGLPVVLLDREIAYDPARRHVVVSRIDCGERDFTLHLRDRQMKIPYRALVCVVEGEVQPGRVQGPERASSPSASSSSNFRAVAPTVGFLAADLHFATVLWVARVDVRSFDFGAVRQRSVAADLAALSDFLAARAGVRVDRHVRHSSLASAEQSSARHNASWPPPSLGHRTEAADQRFDSYSRYVGEAERLLRRMR